jgi:hypothetical protein
MSTTTMGTRLGLPERLWLDAEEGSPTIMRRMGRFSLLDAIRFMDGV